MTSRPSPRFRGLGLFASSCPEGFRAASSSLSSDCGKQTEHPFSPPGKYQIASPRRLLAARDEFILNECFFRTAFRCLSLQVPRCRRGPGRASPRFNRSLARSKENIHRAQSVSRVAPAILLRSCSCPTCQEKACVAVGCCTGFFDVPHVWALGGA